MSTLQTFTGSCSCKHIKYTVALDTSDKTFNRCNCTYCQKFGFASVKPDKGNFTMISPREYTELPEYKHRRFCPTCAVMVLAEGEYEWEGQTVKFFQVNAATLDQPQEGLELSEWKPKYFDGLHDNWTGGLTDEPFKGNLR